MLFRSNCQQAFDDIKRILTTYPVLRLPDPNKEFILKTDASIIGRGAILCQTDDNGNEYVIWYISKLNNKHEQNYSISELECLAIVWAVCYFRQYLYGRKFTIITDHLALKWLLTIKNPNARLTRWSLLLQTFDFEILHRAGKKMSDVDCLSRPVLSTIISDQQDEDNYLKNIDPWEDSYLLHFLTYGRHVNGSSKKQCKRVSKLAKFYIFKEDKLFHRKTLNEEFSKIVPKLEERHQIIKNEHEIGHFKKQATLNRLKEMYYWKNMETEIERHINKCEKCLMFDKMGNINELAKAIKVTGIFDNINIDCVFGFDETREGYIGYLSITCNYSKLISIYPLKTKNASEIAKNLLKWISTYGQMAPIYLRFIYSIIYLSGIAVTNDLSD